MSKAKINKLSRKASVAKAAYNLQISRDVSDDSILASFEKGLPFIENAIDPKQEKIATIGMASLPAGARILASGIKETEDKTLQRTKRRMCKLVDYSRCHEMGANTVNASEPILTASNTSEQQHHQLSVAEGADDWLVIISEVWHGSASKELTAAASIPLTKLVHLLANITPEEVSEIASREI